MKAKKLRIAAALLSAVLLAVIIGGVLSYLTTYDSVDNLFTLGSVDIILSEPDYPTESESRIIVPYSTIPKNPQVTNVGKNDAYIFMKITVPKLEVEPVNADGSLKYPDSVSFNGSERSSRTEVTEVFRLISKFPMSEREDLVSPQGVPADDVNLYTKDWYKLSYIDYNKNWYLIDKKESDSENTYIFAYNKALPSEKNAASENETKTEALFDKVELVYFVEDETFYISPEIITVQAYAIQADTLLSSGNFNADEVNKNSPEVWQLKSIYQYFKNQSEVGI